LSDSIENDLELPIVLLFSVRGRTRIFKKYLVQSSAHSRAAVWALTGGLVGALVGYGIPEEEAKEYEQGIREGGVVLIVVPRSVADADALENEWRGSRGEAICR
jgi:hypothetical protein